LNLRKKIKVTNGRITAVSFVSIANKKNSKAIKRLTLFLEIKKLYEIVSAERIKIQQRISTLPAVQQRLLSKFGRSRQNKM